MTGLPVRALAAVLALAAGLTALPPWAQETGSQELVGLWEAKRRFGPDVEGSLILIDRGGGLVADIAGHSVPVQVQGARYRFVLPGGLGAFRGEAAANGREIRGFWTQPRTVTSGFAYDTPVTLKRLKDRWKGDIRPLQESFTLFLPVKRGSEGELQTFLRNPDRNEGVFLQARSLKRDGDRVQLIGTRRGGKAQVVLAEGAYGSRRFTLSLQNRGGSYDFHKVEDEASSPFFPRGKTPERYLYTRPLQRDDGWPTATLDEVGLSRPAIEAFVQSLIAAPMTAVGDSQIHSVLIARHGKLVLEEYFHGYDRDRPHDTRSAGKSLTATLAGAAFQAGLPVSEATPVYRTMLGALPADLDPRKRAMTLGHLLTMTGGHFCDDSNPSAPGNEDRMLDQEEEPDYYRYILNVPMDRVPGEKPVYCSIDPHLAGGVIAKATGERAPELFDRLVARPLQMGDYHLNLSPTGDAYMGGGAQLIPRDFLKIAQLMVDDGRWGGRQVVGRDWARKARAPLRELAGIQYGHLWWSMEHPYKGKTVRAFFAGGNGGQTFMGVPELDLVIAFTGGNYADKATFVPQRVLAPKFILPAVRQVRRPCR